MRPPVHRGPGLVLARVRVQHLTATHDVGDHVEIATEIGVAEIGEYRAVAVHLFDIVGEALLGDAHEEALAHIAAVLGVVQAEVDLGVLADRVAEVAHAEVQVVRQDFLVLFATQGAAAR